MWEQYWYLQNSLMKKGFENPVFLGRGAFGRVYRVRERATGRLYACKVGQEGQKEQLSREAELLEKLRHPLFPGYKAFWKEEAVSCLIIEYVAGSSLENLLLRRGRLSERQTIRISVELAEGILYLHKRGIIYRDVNARNILLRQDGRIKLVDLGCACIKGEKCGVRAGTPGFAAPGQFTGERPDFGNDVYALGRVMQYMLSGRKPCAESEEQLRNAWKKVRCRREVRRIVEGCIGEKQDTGIYDMYGLLRLLEEISPDGGKIRFRKTGIKFTNNYFQDKNIWKSDCNKL